MPRLLALFLIFNFFGIWHLQAQSTHFSERCELAYRSLLDLDFEALEMHLDHEFEQNPENLFIPYLKHYGLFVKYYVQPGILEFDLLSSQLENSKTQVLQNNKANGYWRNYFEAEMQLHEALIQLNEQHYISGFFKLRSTYLFSKELVDQSIIAHPAEKTLAICEALFSAIPEQYQWVLRLLSIDVGLSKSEDKLYQLSKNPMLYFEKECILLSAALQLHLGGNAKKAYELLKGEQDKNPPLFYKYLMANTANYAAKNDTAIILLEDISFEQYKRFPMLFMLRGKLYLQKLDNAADLWLKYFLDFNKGENYIKSAYHYLSWNALAHDDIVGFGAYQQAVLNNGVTNVEADRAAQKAALSAEIPDKDLLKARLLFDGGYFIEALNVLKPETQNISIEKHYRLGRIYHELDSTETALFHYKKVIEASGMEGSYMPANSAYLSGQILYQNKKYDQAEFYFEKVFEYEDHAYELSLGQKAKIALRELKKSKE